MAGLENSRVKLYFDDTGKVLVKIGTIISQDVVFVQIKTDRGIEAIPTCKIVRMEVLSQ